MAVVKSLKQVALLVDSASGWGRRIIEGVLHAAAEHHRWRIWVAPQVRETAFVLPSGWDGDGVIARIATTEVSEYLGDLGLPVINVSSVVLPENPYPRVVTDHHESARLALDHLTSKGFKRIGYVGPIRVPWVRTHFLAFEEVLKETHDLKPRVFSTPLDYSSQKKWRAWLDLLSEWLREQPKPIGVVAWSAQLGREVVEACRQAGIQVPHEVAVLGSNSDGLLDRACNPPLAGIDEPGIEIGRTAAHQLDRLMRKQGPVPALTLIKPARVIPGGSTDTLAVSDPQLLAVLRFIDAHAFEEISISDILRHVPMARRSLERKFREAFDSSPAEEIRRRRISKAQSLLLETNMPMSEIAVACGYASYNYLHAVFKKGTGISPSAYRQQYKTQRNGWVP